MRGEVWERGGDRRRCEVCPLQGLCSGIPLAAAKCWLGCVRLDA